MFLNLGLGGIINVCNFVYIACLLKIIWNIVYLSNAYILLNKHLYVSLHPAQAIDLLGQGERRRHQHPAASS